MKLSTKYQYGLTDFDEIIAEFSERTFRDTTDFEEGNRFIQELAKHLDKNHFPCDQLILYPQYNGYDDLFSIRLKYEGQKVADYDFKIDLKTLIVKIKSTSFQSSDIQKLFKNIVRNYVNEYNNKIFRRQAELCGIKRLNKIISVTMDDHKDYQKNGKQYTIKGNIGQIFEQYTTHNDQLKYCNGMYWKFNDKNIDTLYRLFLQSYDGNYFLDNAVKRGCIID